MENLKKWNYGNYSSNNYGAHCMAIKVGERTIYFSYDTPIAFIGQNSKGKLWGLTVCRNIWGSTTGKHLNAINPNHKTRLEREKFKEELTEFLE